MSYAKILVISTKQENKRDILPFCALATIVMFIFLKNVKMNIGGLPQFIGGTHHLPALLFCDYL